MSDAKFVPGLFFKPPHENAPDFVIAKGSIKVADLAAFLSQQTGEWVNFDLKRSRDGKPYAAIDDWKPSGNGTPRQSAPRATDRAKPATAPADDFDSDSIPF